MTEADVTTMGEKGQVVIPAEIRKTLGTRPKMKFAVYAEGDVIILKKLQIPDVRAEWERLFARKRRVTDAQIAREVRAVRKAKKR